MNRLELSTSLESGVFDYEVGPVAERVRAVYESVQALGAIGEVYDRESDVRERIGAGWSERADVVGAVAGVVSEEVMNMAAGDKFGGLRTQIDTQEIIDRAEQLSQDTMLDIQPETQSGDQEAKSVEIESNVIDFAEAQKQKAQEIAAREALDKAYSAHQNVA